MSDGMSNGGRGESPSAANLVKRRWTQEGASPLGDLQWATREVRIDGAGFASVAEFPVRWSDGAAAITASKYFRRRGVGPEDGGERSLAQVVTRIASAVSGAALRFDLTDGRGARALSDEIALAMASQRMAFNSPVWFNAGLHEAYGITSVGGGSWAWDPVCGRAVEAEDAYRNPQCSACFILSVEDSLESIFEVAKNEARIFKFGSGSGVSVSSLRGAGEPLRGGGVSSGTLSWLRLWDAGAGGIKSGGTTRRAATMRVMGDRHPDVFEFVRWKAGEEDKIDVLVAGGYSNGIEGEAQRTVSGQNSNNSVRLSDDFMRAVEADGQWQTLRVVDGKVAASFPARKLWRCILEAAHRCADPGVQFDDTINRWNTVPNTGRINATNPCSEFVFLDDTSCNLASLNLVSFYGAHDDSDLWSFDVPSFRHAVATTTVAMEAIVDYASYPTRAIAERTHMLRPLGIGYSNLGSLLMRMGLPYDSDAGRAVAAAVTSLMCAEAYATSARMAAVVGPFAAFAANRGPMLDVVRRHRAASRSVARTPQSEAIARAADEAWDEALELGERYGYRNAQVTVLAPTGTISFAMDCDTTGVEPDFALVNFKTLVGGGVIRQVNGAVPRALAEMGYASDEVERIVRWVVGSCSFADAPVIDRGFLLSRGLTAEEVDSVESRLPSCQSIEAALSPRHLGQACVDRLGLSGHADGGEWRHGFSPLSHWGVSQADAAAAEEHVLGRHTIEGCPGVPAEVVAVFDCANRCGRSGRRFISPMGHLRMLGAVAPFLSGSASKTINLPSDATVEDIESVYMEAWRMGVKCVAVYRDRCKSAQPLGTSSSSASSRSRESHARSILERTEPSVVGALLASPAEALHAINSAARSSLGQPARARGEYDAAVSSARASVPKVGERRRLPRKRNGFTQEARVGGHKIFLRTGEYADGQLGEIFIDVSKAGGTTRAMMNSFAIAVSLGLQHGVPVAEFVDAFTFTRFDPAGPVQGDENGIRFALSITDYVARVLGVHYLRRSDLAHVAVGGAGIDDGPGDVARAAEHASVVAEEQPEVGEMEICGSCGGVKRRTGRCMTCPTCGSPDGGCS